MSSKAIKDKELSRILTDNMDAEEVQELINSEALKNVPKPIKAATSKIEYEARIQQVIAWISSDIRGVALQERITATFKVSYSTAYRYIQRAQGYLFTMEGMDKEQLRKFCSSMFIKHAHARNRKVSIVATRELGKHCDYYPQVKRVELGRPGEFDAMSEDDLKRLAQQEGIEE
jgi:hypothetical protein